MQLTLQELADKIHSNFNLSELKDLCFKLKKIDYEDLSGDNKNDRVRELVLSCERKGLSGELLNLCKILRPKETWNHKNIESTSKKPIVIGMPPVPNFTGRSRNINQIQDWLRAPTPSLITVYGDTGSGKSSLVSHSLSKLLQTGELAELFPDGVISQRFYEQATLDSFLENIFRHFNIDLESSENRYKNINSDLDKDFEVKQAQVANALTEHNALLLLDGLERAENSVLELMNSITHACSVIITTQNKEHVIRSSQAIKLDSLNGKDAEALLKALILDKDQIKDEVHISQICAALGNIPIAIDLAGRRINYTHYSTTKFLHMLEANPFDALKGNDPKKREDDLKRFISSSVEIWSKDSQTLLAFMGCLALSPITEPTISFGLQWDKERTDLAIFDLLNFGPLIRFNDDRVVLKHALYHQYGRLMLPNSQHAAYLDHAALQFFYKLALDEASTNENYSNLQEIEPHAIELIKAIYNPKRVHTFPLILKLSKEIWNRTSSISRMVEVVEICQDICDYLSDPDVSTWLYCKALILRNQLPPDFNGSIQKLTGSLKKIQPLYKKLEDKLNNLQEIQIVLPPLSSQNHTALDKVGIFSSIETPVVKLPRLVPQHYLFHFEKNFQAQSQFLDEDILFFSLELLDPVKLQSELELVRFILKKRNLLYPSYDELKTLQQKNQFKTKERKLNTFRMHVEYTLSITHRDNGEYGQAEIWYLESLKRAQHIGNSKHVADCLGGLGITYDNAGILDSAIEVYGEAIKIYKDLDSNPKLDLRSEIERNIYNLGIAYWYKGDYEKAKVYMEDSLERARTLNDKFSMVIGLLDLGRFEVEVEDNFKKGLALCKEAAKTAQGTENVIQLGHVQTTMGYLKVLSNEYIGIQQIVAGLEQLSITNKYDLIVSAKLDLADAYIKNQQFKEALNLIVEVENITQERHAKVILGRTFMLAGEALFGLGDELNAKVKLEYSVEILREFSIGRYLNRAKSSLDEVLGNSHDI